MAAIGEMYAAGRGRITELVSRLSDEQASALVPACPEWSVKDVVAHCAGVCDDVLAGRIDGVATDPWTEAQVAARRGHSLVEILAEWAEKAPQVEAIAEHFPGRVGTQWVLDITTHEHDLRGALGKPGTRETPAIEACLGFLIGALAVSVDARGLPPLEVRAGEQSWVLGTGQGSGDIAERLTAVLMGDEPPIDVASDPVATVEASPYEWVRALVGRRSVAQVRRFKWSGDPEPFVPAFSFGPFRPSPTDLTE